MLELARSFERVVPLDSGISLSDLRPPALVAMPMWDLRCSFCPTVYLTDLPEDSNLSPFSSPQLFLNEELKSPIKREFQKVGDILNETISMARVV